MNKLFEKSSLSKEIISRIPLLFNGKDENQLAPILDCRMQLDNVDDLYSIFMHHWSDMISIRPDYVAIYFRNEKILGVSLEAIGQGNTVELDVNHQIQRIKLLGATGIATADNSRKSLTPSKNGLKFFIHSLEQFELMNVDYYDHIILNAEERAYYSFRLAGLL